MPLGPLTSTPVLGRRLRRRAIGLSEAALHFSIAAGIAHGFCLLGPLTMPLQCGNGAGRSSSRPHHAQP
jgi:hypothetical protein